jgi:uncharacterized membrane protein YfcA
LPANVTNAVAFVTGWPGSALGSRPELDGQGPWLRRWAPLAVAGSAAGAALLLVTPARAFDQAVPFLLAFAALALLLQPKASAWLAGHGVRGGKAMITTLRWRLIAVPGRLVRHARHLILRLPPVHSLLPEVLARLRDLPVPA